VIFNGVSLTLDRIRSVMRQFNNNNNNKNSYFILFDNSATLEIAIACTLALGYVDDVTLGGPLSTVVSDVALVVSKGASLGLG